jgi:alpha-beta hydrolase superfamily lysophospholipase
MRLILWGAVGLVLLLVGLALAFPRDGVGPVARHDAAQVPANPEAWLAAREAAVPGLVPGAAKRIIWAGEAGVPTPLALIYVHGFSATAQEIRPVPDEVARALGANLFFTRLTGHGQDGDALARATAADWIRDMAEAMTVGRRIGGRVVVIGTSTGATLAAIAAADAEMSDRLAGVVLISPNFGLVSPVGEMLDLPLVRWWGPLVAGRERNFVPQNAEQARYWTLRYPTSALFPMAALVRHARGLDLGAARMPALILYSAQDQVIDTGAVAKLASAWGGAVRIEAFEMQPGDDAHSHVIAGDILSPGQTERAIGLIRDWVAGL